MKTTILTIATLLTTVFGISQLTFAATRGNEEVSTTLTEVSHISKIEVHGNVELFVSDGTADQVKVYNNYYAESALVQNQDGLLRITSYTAKTLKVWVTVSDLRDLSVYDNAEVRSFGKLSGIDLDVKLYNNASAKLDLDAYAANVTLSNHAKADITGNITEGQFKSDRATSLNTTNLVAAHLVKTVIFCQPDHNELPELASL